MPDPRTIALEVNDASKFEDVESNYDPMAGVPRSLERDHNPEAGQAEPPIANPRS